MPVTRLLAIAACCAVLAFPARAQTRAFPTPVRPPSNECPAKPAECQINVQAFDFGRGQMSPSAPPINGFNTISVTCNRSVQADRDGRDVDVTYVLKAVPATPARQMRDNQLRFLAYDMYVDPARTKFWGDGYIAGTFALEGALFLDNRNRVGTFVHQLYGQVHGGQPGLPGQWLGLVGVALQFQTACR